MDSRWARVARGITAAAFATFVAAFSHTISGGVGASMFGITASFIISAMVCTLLTIRTLSLWRLATSVSVSQVLFHWLFSSAGTPVTVAHNMNAMSTDVPAAHLHGSPTMWAAHAVAALVTVVAFRFGEQAFWGVIRTARLLFSRLLVIAIPVLEVPRPVVRIDRRFVPRDLALFLSSMRHRGPPLELLA
ncbi:MAG: hypothetical protein KF761_11450 [Salinibacterium sp.]|nr:hypothetical protein [Salinibacterium sp.]